MTIFTLNGVQISFEDLDKSVYKDVNSEKNLIRIARDKLLAETDIWALSDRTMTTDQADYRQALRDITDQAGFPTDITWPTKPE